MMTRRLAWALLILMVFVEAGSTLMLRQSEGLTILQPAIFAICGYGVVLYLFSHVLTLLPASLAYAVWTGLGTLLVILVGWLLLGEAMSMRALIAIAAIVAGVILINRKAEPRV